MDDSMLRTHIQTGQDVTVKGPQIAYRRERERQKNARKERKKGRKNQIVISCQQFHVYSIHINVVRLLTSLFVCMVLMLVWYQVFCCNLDSFCYSKQQQQQQQQHQICFTN